MAAGGKRAGAGRKLGVPNKANADAKSFVDRVESALARRGGTLKSLEDVAMNLLACGSEQSKAKVLEMLMAYKYGRPSQAVTGEGGGPVVVEFGF